MKAPRCISLGAGIQTADYTILVDGCGLKYGAAYARRTGRHQVEVGSVEGWSEVSTLFCTLDTYQRQRFEGCPIQ